MPRSWGRPSVRFPRLRHPARRHGLGAAVGLYGVAFGAAAVSAGLDVGQAAALSALMFTGASQWPSSVSSVPEAAPSPRWRALILEIRNTIYGVQPVPLLVPQGALRRAGAAHWASPGVRALHHPAPRQRREPGLPDELGHHLHRQAQCPVSKVMHRRL